MTAPNPVIHAVIASDGHFVAAWAPFYTAVVAALGALTGLLFVAISNNLARILQRRTIVGRAAQALSTLVALLVVAGVVLIPQPLPAAGIEVALTAGGLLVFHAPHHVRGFRSDDRTNRRLWSASRVLATAPSLLISTLGGVLLAVQSTSGPILIATGILTGIIGVTYSSWVLLVEVLRRGGNEEPLITP